MMGYLTSLYLNSTYSANIENVCSSLEAGWQWLRASSRHRFPSHFVALLKFGQLDHHTFSREFGA